MVPPIELISRVGSAVSAGVLAAVIGPKVLETEAAGSVVATEPVVHSTRTRPGDPKPPPPTQELVPPFACTVP